VDATGTFTVSLTAVNSSWLCIRIDFNDGGSGQPATWFSPASIRNHPTQDTGTHDLGIIYTNTGPAAVTLNQVSAAASAGSPALIAFGMMLLGAVSLVAVRRSRI
jgi:hypothetical protein